ncbi:MAG: outer membrane protein transport protein [Acidobacteria bacterium]|nr:outer membrane protein transport protein [Acidobacteriota bacterium]
MIRTKPIILMALFFVALVGAARADGFAINEQGARAMAQAGAFAARASDPSALFFNPAGITQLEGIQFYTGGTAIKQKSTWDGPGVSVDSNDKWELPPHFFMTTPLGDRFHLGVGLYAPYGLSKRWPDSFPGKYSSQLVNLQVLCLNPVLAVKVNDRFSVGFGFDIVRAMARLDRALYLQGLSNQIFGGYPLDDGYFSADVKDTHYGFNAGVQWKITDRLSFGASYRSQVRLKLEGRLDLTTPVTGVSAIDAQLAALFPDQDCETRVTLPDQAWFGLGGKLTDWWDTEVDAQWIHWTDYDELPFYFDQQTAVIRNTVIPKNWGNGWAIRWGHEFHLDKHHDIRAGFYVDGAPNPDATLDPMLPDSTRLSFQGGYGWHKGPWTVDFAYMFLHFIKRDINTNPAYGIVPNTGSYRSHGHLIGLSMGYRF